MVMVRTPEAELKERDEFISQLFTIVRKPGEAAPATFARYDFPNRSAKLRESVNELKEDHDAAHDALSGFNEIRRDYTQLIRAFNQLIEIANKFDGGNRRPITPEEWRERCDEMERNSNVPLIGNF